MNHLLKHIALGLTAACLLASGALAAQITPSVTQVELGPQEQTLSFDLTLTVDEAFAGAEFGIKPSASDVALEALTYLPDVRNEPTVKTVKDGVLYFGFFSSENKYQPGTYDVARLTYTYQGTAPRSIALASSKIVTIDEAHNQTVGDASTPPFRIQITRAGSGSEESGGSGSGAGGGASLPVQPQQPAETPPEAPVFTDVHRQDYFHDAVYWAVRHHITLGVTETSFAPQAGCTRAQAVTFLWRAAGSPAPAARQPLFADVPADAYYADAVLWAVETGVTRGVTETAFQPDATCTRAQIVTFLWRFRQQPSVAAENPFADVPADAYYADAVLWAVEAGVTRGVTETAFQPDATCTRAQIVTFLYRALNP